MSCLALFFASFLNYEVSTVSHIWSKFLSILGEDSWKTAYISFISLITVKSYPLKSANIIGLLNLLMVSNCVCI